MFNPYQVLGVSRNDSEEEIKKKYRKLSRKYHPDANINNPNRDKAEEQFKQIQQAYQQIINEKNRADNPFESFGFGGTRNEYTYTRNEQQEKDPYLQAAQNYISNGYYKEAKTVLDSIVNKTARWYFCSAQANAGLRNNIIALEHAKKALEMEPDNWQYREVVRMFESGENRYNQQQTYYNYGQGSSFGKACCTICIANTFCSLCCQ